MTVLKSRVAYIGYYLLCAKEEKGMTEDEMVGWHHRLYGHDFE